MMARVYFHPSKAVIEVALGTTLLEAADAAGMPVGNSCGADGICGRCGLRVIEGEVPPPGERERRVASANRLPSELRLSCMTPITGDLKVTADYW